MWKKSKCFCQQDYISSITVKIELSSQKIFWEQNVRLQAITWLKPAFCYCCGWHFWPKQWKLGSQLFLSCNMFCCCCHFQKVASQIIHTFCKTPRCSEKSEIKQNYQMHAIYSPCHNIVLNELIGKTRAANITNVKLHTMHHQAKN